MYFRSIWTENGYLDADYQPEPIKPQKEFKDFTADEVVQFFRENNLEFLARALEMTDEDKFWTIVRRTVS